MKRIVILSLLFVPVIISGCSIRPSNNQLSTSDNSINSVTGIQPKDEITKDQPTAVQSSFKTYSNTELGIVFDYPKEWPEPVLIINKLSDGSYFDSNNQWEIGLGDLHINSIEGADKYFASIRGYYPQNKEEVISQLNDDKNKGSLWLIDQFENEQASYVIYGEAGIVGVRNIMFFGQDGKTIKIQSIKDSLNADIYSVALSLHSIK